MSRRNTPKPPKGVARRDNSRKATKTAACPTPGKPTYSNRQAAEKALKMKAFRDPREDIINTYERKRPYPGGFRWCVSTIVYRV